MIRVLHVVGPMDLGGAESFIMNIYRNIDREKVQFDFLCLNRTEAQYTQEILSLGGRLYSIPGISHGGLRTFQKNLYRFFCEHPEYKTVHSHLNDRSGIILTQAKKAGVINRYAHSHIANPKHNFKRKLISSFFKLYFKNSVTHPFACANAAGKSLYSGKLRKNFEFIPNSIDTEKFKFSNKKRKQFREEFGFTDEILIGHIGRFMEQKNHKFLIKIFNEMLKNNGNIHLILIGLGELKDDIENQVKSLNIEKNVHFLGARRDIPEFLAGIDLLLFPSLFEGLSVAMVEAQASGVPILTSTSISDEVVITDRVSMFSLENTVDKWAKKAFEIMEYAVDNERDVYAQQVANAGFGIELLANKMQNFYLSRESEILK